VPTTLLAGLWTRPSSATLNRPPEFNLVHLRQAVAAHRKRIWAAGIPRTGMMGLFVAPEYYFARAEAGAWSPGTNNFRSRAVDQQSKDLIVEGLKKISADAPGTVLIPGSIAWRKPFDRPAREKYHLNELTRERTGPLKAADRRAKNVARITGVGDFGMGGATKSNDPFMLAVATMIETNGMNCRSVRDQLLAGGMSPRDATRKIYIDLMGPGLREMVCTLNGLDPRSVSVLPGTAEKVAAAATATYMMRNTAYLLYNGKVRFKYNKKGDFHESIGAGADTVFIPGDRHGLTDPIEGVTFGLEVCLDHQFGLLRAGFPPGKAAPHVHVVVSDKTDNNPTNMHARKYLVHASTSGPQTSVWDLAGSPKVEPAEEYTDTVDGGEIRYWKLSIEESDRMT
jgi:hypothetical protein